MVLSQVDRVDSLVRAEHAPRVRLSVAFESSKPAAVLVQVRDVMRLLASAQLGQWPSDDWWRQRLPRWFIASFEGRGLEEIIADPTLWDFGSWIDAMKDPGWEWWSSGTDGQRGYVECSAHAMPFSFEPLLYLLRAAGAESVVVREIG